MPTFRDRVKDTTTTTGTGSITLSGTAPTSHQSFNTAFGLNVPYVYCIVDSTSGLWETGTGYLSAATTMVRDSAFDGSSGPGVLVNFSAGTKDVFCTATAHFLEDLDTGATSYRIYVSPWSTATTYATFATRYFTSATNSYSQTTLAETGTFDDPTVGNQFLYGEISLPATTASATVATIDIDYFMNFALPPGYEVYVGLGTTVAAGWNVCAIGGSY